MALCNVPQLYAEDNHLGLWVTNQRAAYKEGKLSPERISKLESIGFIWDALESRWDNMLGKLIGYRKVSLVISSSRLAGTISLFTF